MSNSFQFAFGLSKFQIIWHHVEGGGVSRSRVPNNSLENPKENKHLLEIIGNSWKHTGNLTIFNRVPFILWVSNDLPL
jgi:hypothetical protein